MKNKKDYNYASVDIRSPKRQGEAWNVYVIALRSALAKAECFFEILGKLVARNPWKTIIICLFMTGLCGVGFLRMRVETQTSKLFVPQNSIAEQALEKGKPYFTNSLNSRTEEIIFVVKNSTNIFDDKCLIEAFDVIERVKNISGYKDLCKPRPAFLSTYSKVYSKQESCDILNPLEMLNSRVVSNKESVIKRFNYALTTPSRLMSNGRAAIFNIKYGLASFTFNTSSREISAKGLRILFYMRKPGDDKDKKDILEWEDTFVKTMLDIKSTLKCSKLVFSAEKSVDDAINESATSEIPLIAVTFAVMFTFSCLMLGKFINPVRGHTWLALLGVLSTGIGIYAGIGVTMALGVPLVNLVGVLPFLVVSIGIDDMFIIVDEFDRQSSSYVPSNRVSYALSKVGATITMTSVTDCIAFYVSTTSAFPAIRYFCAYAAICITVEFLLQITLFVAFLTFDSRRIHKSRNDCCPMITVPDKTCCRLPNQFSLSQKIMKSYGETLLKMPSKIIVCLLTIAFLAAGIFGCMNIKNEFSRKALATKGSYYMDYLVEFEKTFPQTIPVSLEVTQKIDYSSRAVRDEMDNTAKIAFETGYYMHQNFSWVHYFNDFCELFDIPCNGGDFKPAIKLFLNMPMYKQHNLDVILDKQGNILASRILVFLKDDSKATFQKEAMLQLRKKLKERSNIAFSVASDPFIYFEQYAIINKEVINNLIAVSLVILFMLIPFCIHPLVIFFVIFGFVALVFELFGLMYLWNIDLNAISMINLIMAVGFSVDYSAHIAHAFAVSREKTVNLRIIEALTTVGSSVILGGTSTFLGMSLTGFSSSNIFQIFFKMFLGIIMFGLFNGIVMLPVLLSIFSRFISLETGGTVMPDFDFLSFFRKLFCFFRGDESTQQKESSKRTKNSISVMGLSARFASAKNKQEFWELLTEGRNTTTDYPEERYARFKYFEDGFNPTRPLGGKLYVSKGSYLENIEAFDNKFFGISATEARSMDPQQRLLLQGTFEAIEDAGMKLEELQNCCTGVYVGIMNLDYSSVVLRDDYILQIDQFASTGTAFSIAANRLSFALNLNGPSVAADTACSSSLTALSIACDNLERKVVDVAIVAAANIILCPKKQVTICRANMLSPDGKCKVFDERADGYGRGEGIAVFVLKRSDLVDHTTDDPYCEILGWGVNNDGQAAAPITAPSVDSQHGLMKSVLLKANINPKDIQYVEMHGTGTIIGDLVETKSVGETYGKSRRPTAPVLIGSVKSNVNHTESTAGLAGLAKVCLMLKNKQIVATVGIENQSARLGIEDKGMHVQVKNMTWPEHPYLARRLTAVNSFGYGGSNAHLVISETTNDCQRQRNLDHESAMRILVLSARSQQALTNTAISFSKWFDSLPDNLESQTDVAFTLFERRSEHSFRLAISAPSLRTASKLLADFAENNEVKKTGITANKITMQCSRVGFVFGGQGSQWRGMAGDVLAQKDMLQTVTKINKIAKKLGHKECLLSYLQMDDKDENKDDSEESLVTVQLSIFALQYAVAKFLMKNAAIAPLAVGGHSLGDITAACVAGIIKPKEAVKIILARASLQEKCQAKGAMAAVALPAKEITSILEELQVVDQLCIAAVNDKNSVTISGDVDAIDRVDEYFTNERKDVFWRKLATHKAFHSHHMEVIKPEFLKQIRKAKIKPKMNQTIFISSTKGKRVYGSDIDDEYWWNNLREAVLFNDCGKDMYAEGCRTIIEISPRPVLSYYMKAIAKQNDYDDIISMQALPARKEEKRLEHLYVQCIGKIYTLGYPVMVSGIQNYSNGKFLRYPIYSWQETDLWAKDEYRVPRTTLPFLGTPTCITAKLSEWENQIDLHKFEFLQDHKMNNAGIILPGACYVELALEAALWDTKIEPIVVKNVAFHNILPLHERFIRTVKCSKKLSDSKVMHDFDVINAEDEIKLASAKLFLFNQGANKESLTLAEAMTPARQAIQAKSTDKLSESSDQSNEDFIVTDKSFPSDKTSSRHSDSDSTGIVIDIFDSADDLPSESPEILASSSEQIGSEQIGSEQIGTEDSKQLCVYKETNSPEKSFVLSKIAFNYEKHLKQNEFKELAAKTGFSFGETFSLIEEAWSADKKALTKLKLNEDIYKTLESYIIHPCIIDACLQTCIAIGSNDPDRQVIPIGIETVRLNQIKAPITCLYGFAEITNEAENTCDVKLLDNNGNIIMYLHGFLVKDISKANRQPVFETSIYEMNWKDDETDGSKTENKSLKNSMWLILGHKQSAHLDSVLEALKDIDVHEENISKQEINGSEMVHDIQEQLTAAIKSLKCEDKDLIIVNLLPTIAQRASLQNEFFQSAQWLCFESTLETLKTVTTLELERCKIVTVTSQVIGYDVFDKDNFEIPWAATPWGLSRVTNLETKIPVICIDVRQDPCKEDFITTFKSLDDHSIEEGLIVSETKIKRPLFERVTSYKEAREPVLCYRGKSDDVYLSWSEVKQSLCLKESTSNKPKLPEGYVDMKIKYVSSSTGQISPLLDNIKSHNSEEYLLSAVGIITNIADPRSNLTVGDKVIAVFNSKWIKDHVRLPTYRVFRQPEFISLEKSAALPACLALAHNILTKIVSINAGIKSIFVTAMPWNRGLCWAITVLARAKNMLVTFDEDDSSYLQSSSGDMTLSKISDKHMKGNNFLKAGFDCVICSSDLHPVDQEALMNSLHNGGILTVIDAKSKENSTQYRVNNSITLLNIKPLLAMLSHQEVAKALEETLAIIKSHSIDQDSIPEIDCLSISDVCSPSANLDIICDGFGAFSCLIVTFDESLQVPVYPPSMDIQGLKEDRSYVVIGGNRGLGLNTVKWMASRGAGTIITIGRSEAPGESIAEFEAMKNEFGVEVKPLKADVGTVEGIQLLEDFIKDLPPIAGIVNSAAVLDDKFFKDVDRENYRKVMAPKICGTLLLHNMIEKNKQDVDFFILFSSITSVLGNAGQTTYSAANAFMNSFADYRKKVLGKNCLSICWGAMGGAGILERNTKVAALLEKSGLHLLDIPTGLKWMDTVLTTMPNKSNICICDIDWLQFLRSLPSKKSKSIIYDAIRKELPEIQSSGDGKLLEMVLNAKSIEKKREIIQQFIVRWLAAWIGGLEEEIDLNVPLFTYGIDSVGASALKGQIEKDLQIDFEVFYFMQPETTVYKLADDLVQAICKKFVDGKTDSNEEENEECHGDEDDEPLLEEEDEDKLVLPADYLSAIYNPMEAVAKLFMIHPSHRYSGVFQSLGTGFKFQKLFSLYAFGSPDPAYLGEDICSVSRLAKACVEMMREIQPKGPYFLGGYSFGGLVSLEMATILENLGEKVALVVMVDTVRWLPPARSNSHLLLNMFETRFVAEHHIEEQTKMFFRKIATNQLKMGIDEYQDLANEKSFKELIEILIAKAKELSVEIPDINKIVESITEDQSMASRCHDAWIPPENMYTGHLIYIEAEDDKFCRAITGIGKSVDSWLSVFRGKSVVIKCAGDHYSMMEPSRSPDVGKIIAVAVGIRFRNLFQLVGRSKIKSNQKTAVTFFKNTGMRLCLIRKIAGKKVTCIGKLKVSKSENKLKFKPESKTGIKCKFHLKDVMNILEVHSFSVKHHTDKEKSHDWHLFAGLGFVTKKNQQYTIVCFNRQDYFRFCSLIQGVYSLSLPF